MSSIDFISELFSGAVEVKQDQELLNLIHQIKSHKEPPEDKSDIYNLRYPWQKFGGVSSGIYMVWFWYRDEVILEKATKEDIIFALKEFEDN